MRRILLLAILLMANAIPGLSFAQPSISSEIAPTGKLRVAASVNTAVLLARTSDGKITGGVALDVGRFVAEKLGVPFDLVPYPNSDTYSQSFGKGRMGHWLRVTNSISGGQSRFYHRCGVD
jgi:hypothetical protein